MLKHLDVIKFRAFSLNWIIVSCFICLIFIQPSKVFSRSFSRITKRAGLELNELDPCGDGGICRKEPDCPFIKTWIQNKQKPIICNFDGNQPIVCCKSPNDNIFKVEERISAKKCADYQSSLCPVFEGTIFGGVAAKPRELPFAALVGYGDRIEDVAWLCSGSLISTRFVLSAAHCSVKSNPATWARLGDLDYEKDTDDAAPKDFRISRRFIHPNYNETLQYDDIALFQLNKRVDITAYIKPICLNDVQQSDTFSKAVAAGWGYIETVGPKSSHLLKVTLDVLNMDECAPLASLEKTPNGLLGNMVCAGKIGGGGDTCRGDSGGPLFLPLPEGKFPNCTLYTQIALTSFGNRDCGRSPAIYSSIAHHLPWIEGIVWPANDPE